VSSWPLLSINEISSLPYSLHMALRWHNLWRKLVNINSFYGFIEIVIDDSLCLNKIRENLAANLEQSPVIQGYGSADDRLTLFARFPPSFVPFMQYAG
jgi:hypothetical protein